MVSWNKSMASALKVIGYSIIWGIIGIILIFIGFGMMSSQMASITGSLMTGKTPDFANILIGLIVMVIGYIIIICGFLASFMKVLTELIVEETNESRDSNIRSTKSNQFDKELKSFEDDIQLKPDYADKWYDKGVGLGKLGRHDEALKAYGKAIEIKPDSADAWFNRACIFSIKGEKEEALLNLKKAIEIDITNKEEAKHEEDFEKLWNDEDFKKLVE
jgi:tetratricopeptide (TPR) repeat protein